MPAPPGVAGPADAGLLLQALPTPVLLLASDGDPDRAVVRWLNAAASRVFGIRPGVAWTALWRQPAAAALALATASAAASPPVLDDLTGQPWRLRLQVLDGGGGWLVSAESAAAERAADAQAAHFSALLDLARGFGRLGVWERDMRTMQGQWDRQLLAIWGFDPDGPVPDYAEVVGRVLPADLPALNQRFVDSLQQAGRHAMRFRVRGVDGGVRHLHSQWLVLTDETGTPQRQIGLMMDDTEPFALARSASALESQLALAAELAGISVWRHDLQTGRLHCGAQGWQALGRDTPPDGLTLDEARALVHPADLPRLLETARQALDGGQTAEVEARLRHASGAWVLHVLRGNLLRDEQGEPLALIGVAMAASAQQQQRHHDEEMARHVEQVTGAVGVGYWTWEASQPLPRWSARLREMHGLGPDEPPPLPAAWLRDFVDPADHADLLPIVRSWPADQPCELQVRCRVRRRDGEQRTLLSHTLQLLRPEGMLRVGVVVDLTEQLRTEQALQAASEREALALQAAGMGVWQMDDQRGSALWDARMWQLRGRPSGPARVTAAQSYAMVHPDDVAGMQALWDAVRAPPVTQEHEFRVVWPDGQVRWLASRSMERTDPSTGRTQRLGINWDVTDRRTADQMRQEHELAQRAGQARNRFLARMSHELRTPLNAMLGYAQLLMAEPAVPPARTVERARHIATAGEHLLALIDDVLELASLEGGEWPVDRAPVALHQAVHEALALVQPQVAERQLQPQLDLPPAWVLADATRLRQVLLNLLSNAVKYNRTGGRLRLAIRQEAGPPPRVVLTVADDGPGLRPDQQQRLFEPFNRLGAERAGVQGHGIGLAIVKALVTRMQGEVRVRSQPGEGAEFALCLEPADGQDAAAPALQAPAAAEVAAPLRPALPVGVRRAAAVQHRVLYVEDNPVNAQIMAELVGLRGDVLMRVADTGASGLQMAIDWQPELLLLDMHLPDMDGRTFMQQMQARPETARVPCMAVSANAMPEDIRAAMDAGAVAYWTKPLDFGRFLRVLDCHFGPVGS